jgi:hypothetical protein
MRYPLLVTPEAVRAIEQDTGFVGIGDRMIRAGYWKLEESCRKIVMAPHPSATVTRKEKGVPVHGSQAR